MTRPFISFDPFFLNFDVIIYFSILIFLIFPLFLEKNTFFYFLKKLNKTIFSLFPNLEFASVGVNRILFSLFFLLTLINVLRLWSYIFSATAHIIITFSLGLLIWAGIFLRQFFSFFKRKIEHLSPQGTPN